MKYKLKMMDGLCFANICGKHYLIDTASPFTYSLSNDLVIDGKGIKNSNFQEILKNRMEKLSDVIKHNVSGIIGADFITKYGLTIDYKKRSISFSSLDIDIKEEYTLDVKEIHEQKYIILPNIELKGFGEMGIVPMALDSGVKESHLDISIAYNAQYGWKVEYYYPSLGDYVSFDLRFFSMKEENSGRDFMVSEVNDKILLAQMKFIGVRGTLSFNTLKDSILVLDFKKNKLYIG